MQIRFLNSFIDEVKNNEWNGFINLENKWLSSRILTKLKRNSTLIDFKSMRNGYRAEIGKNILCYCKYLNKNYGLVSVLYIFNKDDKKPKGYKRVYGSMLDISKYYYEDSLLYFATKKIQGKLIPLDYKPLKEEIYGQEIIKLVYNGGSQTAALLNKTHNYITKG